DQGEGHDQGAQSHDKFNSKRAPVEAGSAAVIQLKEKRHERKDRRRVRHWLPAGMMTTLPTAHVTCRVPNGVVLGLEICILLLRGGLR
ncbi:Hypothetical predicted protein, partial [Marmota monax]